MNVALAVWAAVGIGLGVGTLLVLRRSVGWSLRAGRFAGAAALLFALSRWALLAFVAIASARSAGSAGCAAFCSGVLLAWASGALWFLTRSRGPAGA